MEVWSHRYEIWLVGGGGGGGGGWERGGGGGGGAWGGILEQNACEVQSKQSQRGSVYI